MATSEKFWNKVSEKYANSKISDIPNYERKLAETQLVEVQRILKPGGAFVSSSACLGDSPMRLIKLITPLGKLLGLMPDVYVFKKAELAQKISDSGFEIESQWCHGKPVESCFIVARKAY